MGSCALTLTLILFSFFLFSSFAAISEAESTPSRFIAAICSNSSDPKFCMEAIRFYTGDPNANLTVIEAFILMDARDAALHLSNKIAEWLRRNNVSDPQIKESNENCQRLYAESAKAYETAGVDYETVKTKVTTALNNARACEKEFTKKPGQVSSLHRQNEYQEKLAILVLEILELTKT